VIVFNNELLRIEINIISSIYVCIFLGKD